MRAWTIAALGAALLGAGCAATLERYADPAALTLQSPVAEATTLDIPVRFFDDELGARWQHKGMGIINDQATFQRLWSMYTAEVTTLPPAVDFERFAILFVYDPEHYNLVNIRGLNVWNGIANPIVERTTWTLPIGGNPTMRKVREQQGQKVPEAKVNVALLPILRNAPGRPGVTALLVEGNAGDEGASRVIPVPEAP